MNAQHIVVGVIIGAFITLVVLLSNCNGQKKDLIISNLTLDAKYSILKDALEIQSDEVEKSRIDYERKLKEYKEKHPKIKKIYITKYINDVNITRSDCNDVKTFLNNIRDIDI